MLVRLLPDQISKLWDIISYAVEQSLPPIVGEHPDKMNRILSAALSGKVQVWASYVREEETKFEGIMLTKFIYDDISETKNLLIYCLYGYVPISDKSWLEGLKTVVRFAKSRDCSLVVAYSNVHHIIEMVRKLGGEADFTFISFKI